METMEVYHVQSIQNEEMESNPNPVPEGYQDGQNNITGDHGEERGGQSPDMVENDLQDYSADYVPVPNPDLVPLRSRSTWPEKRIMSLLDIYINEHPVYLKAKVERQITEFHEYIGQIVNTDGSLVAGLLKNLSREYRKALSQASGRSPGRLSLRGSQELFVKFEKYYQIYNKMSPQECGTAKTFTKFSKPKAPKTKPSSPVMPKIKKLKKTPKPLPEMPAFDAIMNPMEVKIPPVAVMSDNYCKEYIEVMREQNQALLDIGKELRLMRMGYFTEHELSMD